MTSFGRALLRRIGIALVALPIAAGCSERDVPGFFGQRDDASDPAFDAGDAGEAPDVTARPPGRCGDGALDLGEECDDGNSKSSDGCTSSCTRESGGPGDFCADAIALDLVRQGSSTRYEATASGSTVTLFHHYAASCGGGSGADVVYKIVPPMPGRAVVHLAAPFAAVVAVRSGCEDEHSELACADNTTADAGATEVAFPVFANAPVYVFVDGYGGGKGDYLLDVDVDTAFCGNGTAEYPEDCDDGNTTAGDGCSPACTLDDVATKDACPGMGYRLVATAATAGTVSFAGDTSTLTQNGGYANACPSSGGPNAVYAITPSIAGSLSLELLANFANALVHVRRECNGDTDSQFDCSGAVASLTPITTAVPVFAEQTVYVWVDSNSSANSGLYTLNATLTAAVCGNGRVDGGEECDDGNAVGGDGCSSTCAIERDPATYTCPGRAIRLAAAAPGARTLALRGTTAPAPSASLPASKWTGTAACGSSSPDVVYRLTSDIDGYLKAAVRGQFNAAISLRSACDGGAAPGTTTAAQACAREATGNAAKSLFAPIAKETPYYVVVDGFSAGASGPFEVDLIVEPAVCGNSILEGGETCDDGAAEGGDGCSATCQLEADVARDICATAPPIALTANGDGTYGAAIASGTTNLAHDPGVNATHTLGTCSSPGPDAWFSVTPPISGVMTATITSATFRSSLGVRNGCPGGSSAQLACDAKIGNGGQEIVFPVLANQTYPVIVDGQYLSGTVQKGRFGLELKLVPSGCGDTFVVAPEACDDGNTVNGDGCSSTCALESISALATCPGHSVSLTGVASAVRRATVTVDTGALSSNTGSACGGSGPEGIVKVTSDIDGVLEARATAGFTSILYARTLCADPATEIARASCTSGLDTFATPIQKNKAYYLFVDGVDGASGIAKVQLTVTP